MRWRSVRLLPLPLLVWLSGMLTGCESAQQPQNVTLPLPEKAAFITDKAEIARKALYLWNDGSGCKLQVQPKTAGGGKEQQHWLKPGASCYFMKSPGSERAQVYQYNANTRVLAVVGTPIAAKKPQCGREVQGLLINAAGHVRVSDVVLQGSVYCTANGLDNYQYTLFVP